MNESTLFDTLIAGWLALAGVTFLALSFVVAPYGRHARRGWGPTMPSKLGWVIMEAPAALVFGAWFLVGEETGTVTALLFWILWEAHYLHRAFIFTLGLRGGNKRMPVVVAGLALGFNTVNGYLNGRYLFSLSGGYPSEWLRDPRFLVGLGVFLLGYVINRRADQALRNLRQPGDDGYYIPRGGMYRWISCPNYLGEITEWIGWSIATWSRPGLVFAVWTIANLAPRAQAHHRWYRQHFPDYPYERKALVPGLW